MKLPGNSSTKIEEKDNALHTSSITSISSLASDSVIMRWKESSSEMEKTTETREPFNWRRKHRRSCLIWNWKRRTINLSVVQITEKENKSSTTIQKSWRREDVRTWQSVVKRGKDPDDGIRQKARNKDRNGENIVGHQRGSTRDEHRKPQP
jgi:hypothetical protein